MKTENKHTPGEWQVKIKAGTNNLCRIKAGNGSIIADAYCFAEGRSSEEAEANAKLIAACPQLLEALEKLDEAITEGDPGTITNVLLNYARPAIRKATE